MNTALQKTIIDKKLKGMGIEPDTVDTEGLIDSSLTLNENIENITNQLDAQPIQFTNALHKAQIEEGRKWFKEQIEEANRLALEKAKQTKTDVCICPISKKYIQMVAKGISLSCVLISEGGIGKSFLITDTLNRAKVDYVFYNGHITMKALYIWLWENRDKEVIVFDDVSQLLDHKGIVEMMKAALWDNNGKARILSYTSTSPLPSDVPNSFEIKARFVFAFNDVRRNKNIEALMTRMLYKEVFLTRQRKLEILYQIAQKPHKEKHKKIPKEKRIELTEFIEKNTDNLSTLNFRIQSHIFDIYLADKNNWEEYAKDAIRNEQNETRQILRKVMNDQPVRRMELVKGLVKYYKGKISIRTIQRKINEWLELGEIFSDGKEKQAIISLEVI